MEDWEKFEAYIKLWFIAISSIYYCYLIPARISHGVPRLLTLLPIVTLFFILPSSISIVHLYVPTFMFLALSSSKLLLFAFNRGPLSSTPPLPILTFISLALLPVVPKQSRNKISNPFPFSLPKPIMLAIIIFSKAIIFFVMIHVYEYKDNLHWAMVIILFQVHIYLGLEFIYAFAPLLANIFLGHDFEIEPPFNKPYLATSLQDFWGRRWNLAITIMLHAIVYDPICVILKPSLSRLWRQRLASFLTFVFSGLVHEFMFLSLTRVRPTWEVTLFFVMHGVCTSVEVAVKKAVKGGFQLHRAVSGLLTMAFVLVTGGCLFLPQMLRNGWDVKIINETLNLLKTFRSIKWK